MSHCPFVLVFCVVTLGSEEGTSLTFSCSSGQSTRAHPVEIDAPWWHVMLGGSQTAFQPCRKLLWFSRGISSTTEERTLFDKHLAISFVSMCLGRKVEKNLNLVCFSRFPSCLLSLFYLQLSLSVEVSSKLYCRQWDRNRTLSIVLGSFASCVTGEHESDEWPHTTACTFIIPVIHLLLWVTW